ncbi:MAG: pyridoxal-phosphate dependent enzyme, partial [Candidatus Aenigmatarchaeota archaeon]
MKKIGYRSTNGLSEKVDFRTALLRGQAPDKGLYMPDNIPSLSYDTIESMHKMAYSDIAFVVLNQFLENEMPSNELDRIVHEAYDFDVPIQNVYERKHILWLDEGPTFSFKDLAARAMSRLMQYYMKNEQNRMTILTATSGDTGSAVANAFYGMDNIDCVVLFPEREVTELQRRQMTTLGKNVRTYAVDGKFDDCQAIVKQAFSDSELEHLNLSSANSINFGRLLP